MLNWFRQVAGTQLSYSMKNILLSLLLVGSQVASAQMASSPDTVSVKLDHLQLADAVVLDDWMHGHHHQNSATEHQLEMQLKQLKGINLISRGSFAQEVVYRGQQDSRIQVKLNGMRIYSACTDRMDPATSYIVANNLQSAEVSSSCESHCSNSGLAGNVNLKLKKASFNQDKDWRWGMEQQYHTNTQGLQTGLNLESQAGNLAWRVNGTWQKHNNYSAGGGMEVSNSQNQKVNVALNTSYRLSGKELLNLDMIYDLATNIGYPALPMDVKTARAIIAGASYVNHKGLGPFRHWELKVYHNDIFHEMDDSNREEVYMPMDMPGWSQTTGTNIDLHDWRFGKHSISLATEYYTNYRKAEMTMYPPDSDESPMFMLTWPDTRIHGIGLGMSHSLGLKKNTISTSLRYDYESSRVLSVLGSRQWQGMLYDLSDSRRYNLLQVKTSWVKELSSKHSINTAMSYGQRGPSTSELYGFYLFNAHDGFDYLGNPDLKPEALLTAETGYEFVTKKCRSSASIYLQSYSNYIFALTSDYDAMTWGANGVRIYENVGKAWFYGIEADITYKPVENLEIYAKAEYLRGMLKPDFNLPLIPPLQSSIWINYNLGSFALLAQGRIAAEQKLYNTEYGDQYTPGYGLLDLSVAYECKLKDAKLKFEIAANNLMDTYYRDHLNWGGIPGMGRNIIFKMNMSL